ncbi:glycosyltransferase [Tengunoibacter tsumagoiensis]|uniref:Glycosyl transferase family 1 n=1 Tax=Tengunoibacter tsumagoiensis TaxID=2014871 RepID=A0A402A9R8_9CHLR|nr:glycosyltransferase [Tengunoibacter tsumagoiensis]GCE15924.1 glycosyl transferase family 1 [Tengunoibacter tsumagoiensis]
MRILFVAPYPLSDVRSRSYGFASQLVKHHQVTILVLCSTRQEKRDAQRLRDKGFTVIVVPDQRIWKFFRVLFALFSTLPLQVAYDAAPGFRAAITQELSKGYDLLHVEFIRSIGALPEQNAIPIVWDAVDCVSHLYRLGSSFKPTLLLRLLGNLEWRRTQWYEYQCMQRFQHILVTAERERQAFLQLAQRYSPQTERSSAPARITVLPQGLAHATMQPYYGPRWPETLVFSGKMSFHANIAGAQFLVKQIMPLIWQYRPSVRLVIAGSSPPFSIQRLSYHPQIEVTGYVPDLSLYIKQAWIAVCPLPYAVGLQHKILEAMALGTPIVTSSTVAAGLQAIPGEDLFVADDPADIVSQIIRLLDEKEVWEKLSLNGARYVATHHNWDLLVERLTATYIQAISESRQTG